MRIFVIVVFSLSLLVSSCKVNSVQDCKTDTVSNYDIQFCHPKWLSRKADGEENVSFRRLYELSGSDFVALYFDEIDSSFLLVHDWHGPISSSPENLRSLAKMYNSKAYGDCKEPLLLRDSTFLLGDNKIFVHEFTCEYQGLFCYESRALVHIGTNCLEILYKLETKEKAIYNYKRQDIQMLVRSIVIK